MSLFTDKCWTDRSIFKVLNPEDSCFDDGDIVILSESVCDEDARFKLLTEYGKYREPMRNWLHYKSLEYVGELGDNLSEVIPEGAAEYQTLRSPEDYRYLTPDTLIEVVIDGHKANIPLFEILMTACACCSVVSPTQPYKMFKFLNSLFAYGNGRAIVYDLESQGYVEFTNTEEFKKSYFISPQVKAIKDKLAEKRKQQQLIDIEIQVLESELENIK